MCINIYISPSGEEALKRFKYKGGSDSLFYEFIWSPLAQFIVTKLIPTWLAPNVITITGFLNLLIAATFIQIHSWDYRTLLPTWTLYYAAFSILLYQILDNVDGKQARKTNSSSPLGMLFDHGCDTITTWVIGLMVANALMIGNGPVLLFGLLFMGFISFFFAMWSQYHIGFLRLQKINAVDEGTSHKQYYFQGLVVIEIIFFLSAIFGQKIWQYRINFLKHDLNEIFIIVSSIIAFFQCLEFFRSVVVEKNFGIAIKSLLMPLMLIIVFLIIAFLSPTKFIDQHAYLTIYAFGLIWGKMVGHIQLAHIVNESVNQCNIIWLIICFVQVVNILSGYFRGSTCLIDEVYLAYILIGYSLFFYLHFAICVSLHIARVLNISVFKLVKQTKKPYTELGLPNLPVDIEQGQ